MTLGPKSDLPDDDHQFDVEEFRDEARGLSYLRFSEAMHDWIRMQICAEGWPLEEAWLVLRSDGQTYRKIKIEMTEQECSQESVRWKFSGSWTDSWPR